MDEGEAARSVGELRDRAPGEDPLDPYADVDRSRLPDWWRRAIAEFEAHGLRPYRPPRLADGSLKHEVVEELETDLGVDIELRGIDVTHGDDWTVFVDGERTGTVGHHRDPAGYAVFEIDRETFAQLVDSHANDCG